ncbi:unnamed protein product [Amaranthus hypochondriacus]
MLEISSLSNMEGDFTMRSEEFLDCSEANLLDNIDFDDLFGVEFLHELSDLEMDPGLLPDLFNGYDEVDNDDPRKEEIKINKKTDSNSSSFSCQNNNRKNNNNNDNNNNDNNSNSNNNNNNQAKRKTKVEWTPELHRRFVQVVEQLGVDKAVPSKILELMGNHSLTRHNIASHLQKYRSHRKHLLARETEAMHRTSSMGGGRGGGGGNMSPWYPPTMGYPPMTNMHMQHPSFRPLHVWGHPQARVPMPMWPKHLNVVPSTCPLTPTWAPNPSFWHFTQQRRVGVAQVPVPGIPPHTMFKPDQSLLPQPPPQSGSHSSIDLRPSKESIDAAIGDVLAKPWQPLPIGLKPPSMDTVLVELQRQGIFKIPPSYA